ncbi:MAG: hypothetical protein A2020_15805 [Lentisphaerae bacterium GWF2_45_14]|nr:MAG: hypothetical protein A2020_15805 [Lentisphaerae bacterium GWF2_45_14]
MENIYPDNSVILAPLSGFTDIPFRTSARRFGCRYAFTEMIDAGSLVFGTAKTIKFLDRTEDEDWLGVQLVGSDPDILSRAVNILNNHEFSVIDFNMGCPAPKVAKKGEGAMLALRPDDALRVFEAISKNSKYPVSAKIRILDEQDPGPTLEFVRRLANAGARAVTIHGRIRKSFYSGPVFHEIIAEIRGAMNIQIVANGGVMDLKSYDELREKTGCSCVMVARGAMGNPWIFEEIEKRRCVIPSPIELTDEMRKHVLHMADYYGEALAMKIARKIVLDYLKGRGYQRSLKCGVSHMNSINDFETLLSEVRQSHPVI